LLDPRVAVLIVAGLQVPAVPSLDVAGNPGAVEFWQKGPIASKVGATEEAVIVIFIVSGTEQGAPVGEKIYPLVPTVVVLIVAGLQVPAVPSLDVAGNPGAVEFWQKGPIALKVGSVDAVTNIVILFDVAVAGVAHVLLLVSTTLT
jgi:hypothetical protein